MNLECATITEQAATFTVVIVPKAVLSDPTTATRTIQFLERRHFHRPTVLMARDERGVPCSYYGRADLALRLRHIPLATLPWRRVALS
ncbi:MAG TPA: hypothetical protein VNL77_15110 [Roseiflexaceae bacterium]|nr:hypothetical protein [Roseiflexaceae bacterium]